LRDPKKKSGRFNARRVSRESRNLSIEAAFAFVTEAKRRCVMNGIIYLVGLVVVVGVILSFLGLR
jgi:hypothetical protein